mmetsp:Transcript_34645/g.73781  ORF Transcript_34645/g.73781 Transcript_34645/m.73781 type:complete len:86 (+) Transcript_34645:508-765(+)
MTSEVAHYHDDLFMLLQQQLRHRGEKHRKKLVWVKRANSCQATEMGLTKNARARCNDPSSSSSSSSSLSPSAEDPAQGRAIADRR